MSGCLIDKVTTGGTYIVGEVLMFFGISGRLYRGKKGVMFQIS